MKIHCLSESIRTIPRVQNSEATFFKKRGPFILTKLWGKYYDCKMHLYLTGGGEQESFNHLDQRFLKELPQQARLLVIPLATEEQDFEDVLERAQECFAGRKVQNIHLCKDIQTLDFSTLESYDALFFEGGNTFKLIQEVRQCSFFTHLKKFLHLGKTVYADSAGAIVLGSDVQSAFLGDEPDEDQLKLQDYRGLGVLDQWSIHCHYEEGEDDSQLQDLIFATGSPILALPEPTGLYTDGKTIEVFGERPLTIFSFSGQRAVEVGEKLTLGDLV